MSYSVNIDNQTGVKINSRLMKTILTRSLKTLKIKKPAEISVLVTDAKTIRQLNLKYRKKNKATSVLSFVFSEGKRFIVPQRYKYSLGEIFICYSEAKKLAKKEKVKIEEKIKDLLVHGLLHLLGFTHENKKQEKLMEAKAKKLLKAIG